MPLSDCCVLLPVPCPVLELRGFEQEAISSVVQLTLLEPAEGRGSCPLQPWQDMMVLTEGALQRLTQFILRLI